MLVDDFNLPDVGSATDVNGAGGSNYPAFAGAPDVVGIDVQSNGSMACGRSSSSAARSKRFGKYNGHATMKDSVWLTSPCIDWSPGADEVFPDFKKLDAKVCDGRIDMDCRQAFD